MATHTHTRIYIYIYIYIYICIYIYIYITEVSEDCNDNCIKLEEALSNPLSKLFLFIPSKLGLKNSLIASLPRGKITPTSVLDMTLNNLLVRLQQFWNFGKCRVLPSFLSLLGSLCPRASNTCLGPIYGSNCEITLNWSFWNKLFLHLTDYLNCVLMLNWIVSIRTV